MSKTTQSTDAIQEALHLVSTVVVSVVGACFAVGLLIVNLRLASFGVFAAEFVRAEYPLAGALYLFLVACTSAASFHGLAIAMEVLVSAVGTLSATPW